MNEANKIADGIISYLKGQGKMHMLAEVVKTLIRKAGSPAAVLVESATELNRTEKDQIEKLLSKKFPENKDVNYIVNPELIGGIKITTDSQELDLSVQGKLEDFNG